ncbi:2-phospho-L-lactate guanylyltransferase [Halobaculum sp. CBA1158]|uniref:2-phospho-L-lactate guanylyltransferase n=1 Tax=Halobaculum sp. CBA1158 TaxID=2904243 RepID=UPI001F2EEBBB|nr:2-phospho-L-lactate guanylyltransferase [Halobaculum sp. CBA1158]UIO99455.1 2-phospho-L-lactate guanylyltransferase [Halobaculum sp. CBA1158]
MSRPVDALVPFAPDRPKTRLSETLSPAERREFAEAMLSDVLAALRAAEFRPRLLATEATGRDVPETVDDRPLTEAVNAAFDAHDPGPESPLAVVMADLALATPRALARLHGRDGIGGDGADTSEGVADVTIAPGRGGGTNALLVRHPAFRVDYHGASSLDHLRAARDVGATVREVDSRRLATDIDEREDLAEVLLSGDGAARDWLVAAGFRLDTGDGRVSVVREGDG